MIFVQKLIVAFIWHVFDHVHDVNGGDDDDDDDDDVDAGHGGIILLTLPRVTLILPN